MNERKKDENWLDDELRRAIDTTAPRFDAEAWKQNHADAYEALVSRGKGVSSAGLRTSRTVRLVFGGLAAAAVILIAVAILVMQSPPRRQQEPPVAVAPRVSSPARIVSMMSLRTAYRQGGEEALSQQLDTALKKLGPRPGRLSALQVLSDLEG
jgi:hypothetical protein